MASRDIYGRRPTSTSRGKTIDRIMDHQHAPGTIPGAEQVLAQRPAGSIAAVIVDFHRGWVESRPVTTRRAYERSLAFLARDLAEHGPDPSSPTALLARERLVEHLDWRLARSLSDPGELQRCCLHLARLCEWIDGQGGAASRVDRAWLRTQAAARIATAPPPFHVASRAEQLRDTSRDEATLDAGD